MASTEQNAPEPSLAPPPYPDVEALFEVQRRLDPLGYSIHTWLAALACFAISWPVTLAQIGMIPLGACFLIRIVRIYPILSRLGQTVLGKLLMAWAAWLALSAIWSPDKTQAIDEIADLRWMLMVPMLWPVVDRRRILIGALAAGLLIGMAWQVVGVVAPEWALPYQSWAEDKDRMSGWWDPAVGGSVLTAGLGLFIPALVLGRGWPWIAGAFGAAAAAAAILATGTRGAWLASGGLLAIVGVITFIRLRPSRKDLGILPFALAIVILLSAGAWRALGPSVERRFSRGVQELSEAMSTGQFTSDTGARLLLNWWAVEALMQRPLHGVGAGGYAAWVRNHLVEQGIDPATRNIHDHAHNGILHVAATTGLIGVGIVLGITVIVLRGEARRLWRGPEIRGAAGAFDLGPACALLGLVLVSAFDSIHLNAHTAAWLFTLLGLCIPIRPIPVAIWRPWETQGRNDASNSSSPGGVGPAGT